MANTYYDSQLTAEEIEEVLKAINGILIPANNGKVLAISNGKFEARSVQWGGGSAVVQPLSVTQNGTYNPPSGVDGYAPVTVNVSGAEISSFIPSSKPIIVTGKNVSDSDIVVRIKFVSLSSAEGSIFGGAWTASGFFLMVYGGKFRFHSGNSFLDMESVVLGKYYDIECGYDYCIINGTTYSLSPSEPNSGNLQLFTPPSPLGNALNILLKEFSVYVSGNLVQLFKPTNANALLETISETVINNSGTGTIFEIQ